MKYIVKLSYSDADKFVFEDWQREAALNFAEMAAVSRSVKDREVLIELVPEDKNGTVKVGSEVF